MTKQPVIESFCVRCRRTVYGKDVEACPVCLGPLVREAT